MEDRKHLQKILDEFNELMDTGLGSMECARSVSRNHMNGLERDEYEVPVVLYKGGYVLVFGQVNSIYKTI
jgi:hypothetical protein